MLREELAIAREQQSLALMCYIANTLEQPAGLLLKVTCCCKAVGSCLPLFYAAPAARGDKFTYFVIFYNAPAAPAA